MDKKVINEEQFRKLVISEAKKCLSENKEETTPSTRRVTFDSVESLISEIGSMNKSIKALMSENDLPEMEIKSEKVNKREMDLDAYNKNKNVIHVNEGEKDKWQRMLKYEIPNDEQR
jgi:hypothetical protein